MQTFSRYKVIEHHDVEELERLVMDHINNGWEPVGGIAMTAPFSERQQVQLAQALIFKGKQNGL